MNDSCPTGDLQYHYGQPLMRGNVSGSNVGEPASESSIACLTENCRSRALVNMSPVMHCMGSNVLMHNHCSSMLLIGKAIETLTLQPAAAQQYSYLEAVQ